MDALRNTSTIPGENQSLRIFSFLGTGDYKPSCYSLGNCTSSETRFAQVALAQLLATANGHSSVDLVVFATPEAETKHSQGLSEEFRKLCPGSEPTWVRIPAGAEESDFWEIFTLIAAQVDPCARIAFDITHGYRSIPLLALAAANYVRIAKDARLEGIFYGAFEAAPKDNQGRPAGAAPIFNLKPFITLLDWSTAARVFKDTGNARFMASLVPDRSVSLDAAPAGEAVPAGSRLPKALETLFDVLATCRARQLQPALEEVERALADLPGRLPKTPEALVSSLVDDIRSKISPLLSARSHGLGTLTLAAARWCAEQGLIQQAYTLLHEGLVTRVCEAVPGLDPDRRRDRKDVGEAWKLAREHCSMGEGSLGGEAHSGQQNPSRKGAARHFPTKLAARLLSVFGREFLQAIGRVHEWRNDISHAEQLRPEVSATPAQLREDLDDVIRQLDEGLWQELSVHFPS